MVLSLKYPLLVLTKILERKQRVHPDRLQEREPVYLYYESGKFEKKLLELIGSIFFLSREYD